MESKEEEERRKELPRMPTATLPHCWSVSHCNSPPCFNSDGCPLEQIADKLEEQGLLAVPHIPTELTHLVKR